jgi:hypothetical protein
LKDANQGTGGERFTDGVDLGELVAAAEDVEKLRRLPFGATEGPRFVEDDAPRNHREESKDEQDESSGVGRAREERNYRGAGSFERNPTLRLQEQGSQQASERAQVGLRDIVSAPGIRVRAAMYHGVKQLSNLCYD